MVARAETERAVADFTVKLAARKSSVVLLEPVVLQASVVNQGSNALTIPHALAEHAAAFVYQRRDTNGTYQDVASRPLGDWADCGNDRETNRVWQIGSQRTLADRTWVPNYLEPGVYKLRAVFRVLAGEFRGAEAKSDDITVTVSAPAGADKAAYDFWMTRTFEQRAYWNMPTNSQYLILNSGSHHWQGGHQVFINNCSNSVYADYVRYMMTQYLGFRSATEPTNMMMLQQLCERPSQSFPLIGECYVALLEGYKKQQDFTRMIELAERIKRNRAILPPESWPGQLDQLLDEAASKKQ